MDKNAIAMHLPVDRFIGMAELRKGTRWNDEYELFQDEQEKARQERKGSKSGKGN